MLIINQSKNLSLELLQPFNNQWSNNQLDNQLLLNKTKDSLNNHMSHNNKWESNKCHMLHNNKCHMLHNNKLFNKLLWFNNHMPHNNPLFNKLQFNNNKFKHKFMNNQNHKLNHTLKTFQFKRAILIMNKKSTMFKSHMKDNILNKSLNKELNMFQLPEP